MSAEYIITKLNKTRQLLAGKLKSVDHMLDARESLLLQFCTLVDPVVEGTDQEMPPRDKIKKFTEDVIDYMSRGHFDIYPRIVQIMETVSGKRLSLAKKIIPRINKTTDELLKFDSKYGEGADETDLSANADINQFKEDLGKVGQNLELRFSLEDRLVITLQLLDDLMKMPLESKK